VRRAFLLAALAALSVTAALPAEAQRRVARPAARVAAPARAIDWTRTAIATPAGGVRLGNPAAPVKLVEYGSITCSHCAEFAREATAGLYAHVRTGRVSWEYRPYMIFPTDPGIFALLSCQGPRGWFGSIEQLYASQPGWWGRAQAYIEANRSQLEAMSSPRRSAALVRAAGLDAFFRQRGMTPAAFNACLANPRNQQRIADITARATRTEAVQGTPTFFINGVLAYAGSWGLLDVMLRQGRAN
jgi:protein-disulfide isomerase